MRKKKQSERDKNKDIVLNKFIIIIIYDKTMWYLGIHFCI